MGSKYPEYGPVSQCHNKHHNNGCFVCVKPAEGLAAWGYVFDNALTAQNVPVGENIRFNNNGPLRHIIHVPGTDGIQVTLEGVYNISFGVYTEVNNPEEWGVAVNGVVRSLFSADGKALVASTKLNLNAGDVITILNVGTAPDPAVLRSGVNTAWVLIDKVDEIEK